MNIINIEFYLNRSQVQIHSKPSLVPRPFPPPVFDCLQYVKIEREGLGDRVTCLTSGRCDGRYEGGGARSLQLTNFALISLESTEQWAVLMLSFEGYSLKFLDRIFITRRFFVGHRPPPHVYPHVCLMSYTWLYLPGLPPLFLYIASNQKLEVGTAGEQGYSKPSRPYWDHCCTSRVWRHL